MTLKRLALGLFFVSSFLSFGSLKTKVATAQCVQADVSVQYNISGSKVPTKRSNDVVMESNKPCRGNTSVTTGIQGNVSNNDTPVEQHRQVYHRQGDGSGNSTGINGSTVQIRSNAAIDVYNPASNVHH